MQYWPLSSLSVQLSRNATLLALAAAWLVLNLTTNPAQAWGTQGHQVVANLAQAQLSVGARREVDRLLATEPGQTMASISTWADEHRNPATALKAHQPLRFSHSRFQKISPRLDDHHHRQGVKLTVA